MARVLVTGMSGAGKSTLLEALARRGYEVLDTDYGGWILPDGLWDEPRMTQYLASTDTVIVAGTVENQGTFYSFFDHVVLLTAPVDTLVDRARTRTNNPYGRTAEQQAEIRHFTETVEPLLRPGATAELDSRRPVDELADAVELLIGRRTTRS